MCRLVRWGFILVLTAFVARPAGADPTSAGPSMPVIVKLVQHKKLQRDLRGVIRRNRLFLPVEKLFGALSLDLTYDGLADRYHGFFLSTDRRYEIDLRNHRAFCDTTRVQLDPSSFLVQNDQLYLQTDVLNKLFGMGLTFDPRGMKLHMNNAYRFPSEMRRVRRAMNRSRMEQRRRSAHRDTVIRGTSSLTTFFTPGVTRWRIDYQQSAGLPAARGSIQHRGLLLKGDYRTGIALPFHADRPVELNGRWRRYFLNSPWLRQLTIGTDLSAAAHPFRSHTFTGVALTNRFPHPPDSYAHYPLRFHTRGGREVEVYRNHEFLDYRTPAPAGEKKIEVPLTYGSQSFQTRIYGPYGGQRRLEEFVFIPRRMLPRGRWTYKLTGGSTRAWSGPTPKHNPLKWSLSTGYGITDEVTVRAGMNNTFRFSETDAFVSGYWNYKYQYLMKAFATNNREYGASFRYRRPDTWSFDVSANRYKPFIHRPVRFPEAYQSQFEWNVRRNWRYRNWSGRAMARLRWAEFNGNSRGSLRMGTIVNGERWNLRVVPVLTYQKRGPHKANFDGYLQTSMNTAIAGGIHLRVRTKWKPGYALPDQFALSTYKRMGRNWGLSLRGTWHANAKRIGVASLIRWTPDFMRGSTRVRMSGETLAFSQQMSGTLWYESGSRQIRSARRSWADEGRVRFRPFMDHDGNGRKEEGERWMESTVLDGAANRSPSGRTADTYRPYSKHPVDLSAHMSADLHIPKKYQRVYMSLYPGIVNRLPVPLVASGDLSGKVRAGPGSTGANDRGGIWTVLIRNHQNNQTDTLRTLPSGRFYRSNLPSGRYTVRLSESQLGEYGLRSNPRQYEIRIRSGQPNRLFRRMDFQLLQR